MRFSSKIKYYVYTHSVDGNIFYVGKGSGGRALDVESRNNQWKQFIDNHDSYDVDIVRWFAKESAALKYESDLIKKIRPGCNIVLNSDNSQKRGDKSYYDLFGKYHVDIDIESSTLEQKKTHQAAQQVWSRINSQYQNISTDWLDFRDFHKWMSDKGFTDACFYLDTDKSRVFGQDSLIWLPRNIYDCMYAEPRIYVDKGNSYFVVKSERYLPIDGERVFKKRTDAFKYLMNQRKSVLISYCKKNLDLDLYISERFFIDSYNLIKKYCEDDIHWVY